MSQTLAPFFASIKVISGRQLMALMVISGRGASNMDCRGSPAYDKRRNDYKRGEVTRGGEISREGEITREGRLQAR